MMVRLTRTAMAVVALAVHTSPVPVAGDGHQALAGKHPLGRLPDQLPLPVTAHAPAELAGRLALLGQLQMLPPNPATAVL